MKVAKKRSLQLVEIDEDDWAYIFCVYKKYLKTVKTKQDLRNCKIVCSLFFQNRNTTDYSKNSEIINILKKQVPLVVAFLELFETNYYQNIVTVIKSQIP